MATTTQAYLSALTNTIIPQYEKALQKVFSRRIWIFDELKKRKKVVKTDQYIFTIETFNGGGTGARPDTAALPPAVYDDGTTGTVTCKEIIASFDFTRRAARLTSGKDASAVADVAAYSMQKAADKLVWDCERILFGDGTGTLGVVQSTSGTTTCTITVSASAFPYFMNWIRPKDKISFWSSDFSAQRNCGGGATEVDVNLASLSYDNRTFTFTVSSATGRDIVAGDKITLAGNRTTSVCYEPDGLSNLIGTSTYAGIDPSSYPVWQSFVFGNSGTLRTIDPLFVEKAILAVMSGNEKGISPDYVICNPALVQNYLEVWKSYFHITPADSGSYGYSKLESRVITPDGKPKVIQWKTHHLCPYTRMYLPSLSSLMLVTEDDAEPHYIDDLTGGQMLRTAGYQIYEGAWSVIFNIATFNRKLHARIDDITTTSLNYLG